LKVESVVFAVDDVLYDTSQQLSASRMSAVKAMKSAGLPIDIETTYRKLEEIVKERGPDDTRHFDTLLERLGLKWNPEVIAAGVVAYRATSPVYLTPFPDAVPTLLKLRDAGYKLGVASNGRAVKQWQKLIQLGLEYVFHTVTISEEVGSEKMTAATLQRTLNKLGIAPERAAFVGCELQDIVVANTAKMTAVRMKTGGHRAAVPRVPEEKPAFEIGRLSEIFDILQSSGPD
jgi:putative hydrolase of the HAD superfamily